MAEPVSTTLLMCVVGFFHNGQCRKSSGTELSLYEKVSMVMLSANNPWLQNYPTPFQKWCGTIISVFRRNLQKTMDEWM
jgi:hypothetical protein